MKRVRSLLVFLALGAFAIATPLLAARTGGEAIQNGDEAIYAEMAREMVDGGRWGVLSWQGEALLPRPPGAVWILAASRALLSDEHPERSVRWPLAAAAGAEVALVLLLGAALFGLRAGVIAAGTLVTCDLFIGYARYLESEPFLIVLVLGSVLCGLRARERIAWAIAWGALGGAALMVKQLVGALPLLLPLVDALSQRPWPRRRLALGLGTALLVWLPWHLWALVQHRDLLIDQYLLHNLVERSKTPILRLTRPTFYARELWRSEGVLGLVAVAGIVRAAVIAIRRRSRGELLIASWAILPFVAFSAASSRYDYYLLMVYPALALGAATLIEALPLQAPLRVAVAVAYVATGAALHLQRDLSAFRGDDEVRTLVRAAETAQPARLYTFNTLPYSARYYAHVPVSTLLESADDYQQALALAHTGMPVAAEPAPQLAETLRTRPRPFALLIPRPRAALTDGGNVTPVGETAHYILYLGR